MTWERKTSKIGVGDTVRMSTNFLRSIHALTGEIAEMRGTVTEIKPLGSVTLVKVDWRDGEEPKGVLLSNLSKVAARGVAE